MFTVLVWKLFGPFSSDEIDRTINYFIDTSSMSLYFKSILFFHFQACQMLNALENYYWRYCSASELVNMILAFIETRALAIFSTKQFLELSESMVQLIMNRNLEAPEIAK